MEPLIPNLNTFADLCDRLAVEVHKLAFFENKKREEHQKETPDPELIAKWDNLSRDCCEYRSMLKNAINAMLTQIVDNQEYRTLNELRTFVAPSRSVGDLLTELYSNNANSALRGSIAQQMKRLFDES